MPDPIDGGTSLRDSVESFERLNPRGELPPLPPDLVRGTPGSVLAPVAVQPVEAIQATSSPTPAEQVQKVVDRLHVAGQLEPSKSPYAWMNEWIPDRG